jgi:hypothetical protein
VDRKMGKPSKGDDCFRFPCKHRFNAENQLAVM